MSREKKRGLIFVLILGISVLLLLPLEAFALNKDILVTEVRVGQAIIKPRVSTSTMYMSNIDFNSNHPKSSMIYRVTPGLSLAVPLERLYFSIDADASYANAEHGDHNWTSESKGILRYNLTDMTSVGTSHYYSRNDLYGMNSGNTSDLNRSTLMLKHQFSPKLRVTLDGDRETYNTHIKQEDGTDKFTDYKQWDSKLNIDYTLTPLTGITIGGDFVRRDYNDTKSKSYHGWSGKFGITQKLTPRISLGLSSGYENRKYKDVDSVSLIDYGSTINVILSKFSTLYLSYSHSLQDTFYPKDENVLNNPFARDDVLVDLLNESYKYMVSDRVGLNVNYNLTDKDSINLDGAYITSKSGADLGGALVSNGLLVKLKERNYYGGLGYSHKITSWCSLDMRGSYGKRTSNVRSKYSYYTGSGGLNISF